MFAISEGNQDAGDAFPPHQPASRDITQETTEPAVGPSALNAGILRPKQPREETSDVGIPSLSPQSPSFSNQPEMRPQPKPRDGGYDMNVPPSQVHPQDIYQVKSPSITRGIMTVIIVAIVLLILGGGAWYIYAAFIRQDTAGLPIRTIEEERTPGGAVPDVDQLPGDVEAPSPSSSDGIQGSSDLSPSAVDDTVLFGEPVDADGDGLDDAREKDMNTDPSNWDTDGDMLSDGDEVIIWKTDPLDPDTDNDTYVDGQEIKSGYSPTGPGRLGDVVVPTSTSSGSETQ